MSRTVGVEEEFLLVGADGHELRAAGEQVATHADDHSEGQFEHELMREQAELGSTPHRDLAELAAELRRRRAELAASASAHGARVLAVATAPLDEDGTLTPDRRYRRLAERYGRTARRALSCGMHVHVGVDSRDEGVRVLNGIRAWLPVVLALTANSPFQGGQDTGYESFRTVVWQQWPSAGPFSGFTDVAEYDATVDALIGSGAVLDDGNLYLDARLSARYPTVEIRVADVCARVADAAAVAGLCRALVDAAADGRLPQPAGVAARVELVRAGSWRAARYGMDGELLHPVRGGTVDAWSLVDELVDALGAGRQGFDGTALARIRRDGTGSRLQRDTYDRTGDLTAVVDAVAEQTLA